MSKTMDQIKEELRRTKKCTNIPRYLKDEVWLWMRTEFKGKSVQIGNMMNSKEYGYCATVGSKSFEVYLTPEDYQKFYSAV